MKMKNIISIVVHLKTYNKCVRKMLKIVEFFAISLPFSAGFHIRKEISCVYLHTEKDVSNSQRHTPENSLKPTKT